jgi:hypothetical protein
LPQLEAVVSQHAADVAGNVDPYVFYIIEHLVGLDPPIGQSVHDVVDVAHDYGAQAHDARLNGAVDYATVVSVRVQVPFGLQQRIHLGMGYFAAAGDVLGTASGDYLALVDDDGADR